MRRGFALALLMCSWSLSALHGQTAPSPGERDKALAAIREYALNYAKGLPDYTRTRVTHQKSSLVISIYAMNPELAGQHPENVPSWAVDIEEQLSVVGQRESRRVLKTTNNFPPSAKGPPPDEVFGTISVREFASALDRIFESETAADFHWVRSGKLRGLPAPVFSFDVPRAHGAHVRDNVAQQDVAVAYNGLIYADAESKAVARVEMHSSDFPKDSEFTGMDLTLDYKAAKIGEREFIMPYRFALEWHRHKPGTLAKARELPRESSVEAEYKNYHAYSAQSAIAYGGADSQGDVHSAITFGNVTSPETKQRGRGK